MSEPIEGKQLVRESRLVERAIRKAWPIPEDKKEALLNRQIAIATSESVKPAESTAAFRALLAAEGQNIGLTKRQYRRRHPPQSSHQVIIVEGNLDETKRRALERANQLGLIGAGDRGDCRGDGAS